MHGRTGVVLLGALSLAAGVWAFPSSTGAETLAARASRPRLATPKLAAKTISWPMFADNAAHTAVLSDPRVSASRAAKFSVRWKVRTTPHKVFDASPVIAYNAHLRKWLVYSATEGTVSARDLDTGALAWTRSGAGPIVATPALFGNTVYVASEAHRMYAFDATTGATQCSFSLSGAVISSPVVGYVDTSGPVVFFGDTGTSETHNAGHEWAVNGVGNTNGACTQRWTFNGWHNTTEERTGSWSPPALAVNVNGQPLLVFGSADPDDQVYALDARDGSLVWQFQTQITGPDQDVGAGPTISAPGINGLRNGAVYINGKDAIEYALDLSTGTKIWSFDLKPAAGGAHANSQSSAALIGSRLVVPYAQYLFKLDAVTGRKIWRSQAAASVYFASPSITGPSSDQVIFIGDAAGIEHAYRLHDGTQVFQVKTGGPIFTSAAITDLEVVFGSDDGYLYALS
jgi:outer membrane protein assembly factor BamB